MTAHNQEAWKIWRTCTRKVKYADKPAATQRMEAYRCPYCDGWHRTKRKRRITIKPPPRRPMVLRGGFWIER